MNYDKWNKMDLGGEDEEVGADVATEVNRLKAKADAIFEANENSGRSMPVSYKECIGIYEQITQMVSAYATHLDLSIRCHLNLACCFIRESEWLFAIKHGRTAQKLCTEENWNEKLRALYFELHALCNYFHNLDHAGRLSHHSKLIEADKHVTEMKRTLQFHAGFVSPEHLSDYEEVFHQLAQCLAKVEKDNEGMAESHFEKAQQLQRMHQDQEAVAELSLCAQLTLQLRSMHQASKAAKINILIALIFAHRRDFSSAFHYYTTALTILSNDGASPKDPVLLAVITTSMSVFALKLKHVTPSTAADLFQAVCTLAQCVFDNPNTPADDVNVAFLAHLLTPNAHIIDKTALAAHHSPHTTTTAEYIHAQHLLRACNVLADLHAAREEWQLCNDVTDHTIDICNALIAQFAPAAGTANTTTASVAPIVAVLQRRRAECFVAKAMLYKDHPLLIARPPSSSETATPSTSAAATATDNNTATHTWPSCIPLLTKHSVPTEYNEYATFHRLYFDSVSEAVAVFLQVAGSEYEKTDAVQSMRTFHTLAEYTMQIAQIQPFVFSDTAPMVAPVRSNTNASKNATAFTTTSYAGEIITTTTTAVPPPSTVSSTNANAVDRKDLAEKAADAWAKVSLQAMRQVDAIQAALASLTAPTASSGDSNSTAPYAILRPHYFERYFYLQQSMLALYYAGVCAFHFDLTLSQRNLESAEEVQKSIDALLTGELRSEFNLGEPGSSGADGAIAGYATGDSTEVSASAEESEGSAVTNTSANSAESRSLHGYYATCGDLSYHLSQAYLRLAMYAEALQAATSALAYYEHSERLLYLLNTINQYNNTTVGNINSSSPRTPNSPTTLKNTKSYHSLLKMGVVGLVIPLAETTPTGRLRQRLCLTVCALCHSARGELKLVEQAVRRVGDLCLGPIEDATVEVSAVRRQLSQQLHSIQQEMNATSHLHNPRNDKTAQTRTSNRSNSPVPVSAAIAIDGSKVSNSVVDYNSDENVHSGARFTNEDKPKKNVNNGISNLRVEKVPTVSRKMDYNLLIAYSIVSIVVVAIVVGIYWK